MAKRHWLRAPGVLALGALFALSASAATREVIIDGTKFKPDVLEVHPGDTVVWKNQDILPHTVTSKPAFDSGALMPGKSFKHRMKREGEIDYVCRFHPTMKAKILVRK